MRAALVIGFFALVLLVVAAGERVPSDAELLFWSLGLGGGSMVIAMGDSAAKVSESYRRQVVARVRADRLQESRQWEFGALYGQNGMPGYIKKGRGTQVLAEDDVERIAATADARARIAAGQPPNEGFPASARMQRQWEAPGDYFGELLLKSIKAGTA